MLLLNFSLISFEWNWRLLPRPSQDQGVGKQWPSLEIRFLPVFSPNPSSTMKEKWSILCCGHRGIISVFELYEDLLACVYKRLRLWQRELLLKGKGACGSLSGFPSQLHFGKINLISSSPFNYVTHAAGNQIIGMCSSMSPLGKLLLDFLSGPAWCSALQLKEPSSSVVAARAWNLLCPQVEISWAKKTWFTDRCNRRAAALPNFTVCLGAGSHLFVQREHKSNLGQF